MPALWSGNRRTARSRRGWSRSINWAKPKPLLRQVPAISQRTLRWRSIWRASSRTFAACRWTGSFCGKTGCTPTISRPTAAHLTQRVRAHQRSLFPNWEGPRSPSRSRALSGHHLKGFRLAWIERRYDNGQLAGTLERDLTIILETPRDLDCLRKNPLGIYVNAVNWSKELG
nr:type IV secretory pathway, TrbF components [Bradyrhizobium sp. DOA9]